MSKCVAKKKPKHDNVVVITYELTQGEALALRHALEEYSEKSMVGKDVFEYTENAFTGVFKEVDRG